jgi:hypothetical protein
MTLFKRILLAAGAFALVLGGSQAASALSAAATHPVTLTKAVKTAASTPAQGDVAALVVGQGGKKTSPCTTPRSA